MIEINHIIDDNDLAETINSSVDLQDNEELFAKLASVKQVIDELEASLDKVKETEAIAKGLIKSKANALYGKEWQSIAGRGYKITKSKFGTIYIRNPDVPVMKKFLIIKESLNSNEIDKYTEEKGKLPKGVELNPFRGETIRITIKDIPNADA